MSRPRTLDELRALPWFQRQWHSFRVHRKLDALCSKENPLLNSQAIAVIATNFFAGALIWAVVIHRFAFGAPVPVPGTLAWNVIIFALSLLFVGFAAIAPVAIIQTSVYKRFLREHADTMV